MKKKMLVLVGILAMVASVSYGGGTDGQGICPPGRFGMMLAQNANPTPTPMVAPGKRPDAVTEGSEQLPPTYREALGEKLHPAEEGDGQVGPPPVEAPTPAPTPTDEEISQEGKSIIDHLTSPAAIIGHMLVKGVADKTKAPNIVVIMGDDIGIQNISAYHRGKMGGSTPNIDKIGADGAIFQTYYTQQSCTAGRSTFITGQSPLRSGMLKVGLPGAPEGLQDQTATLAQMLKQQGYNTAQFGKNHLGDLNQFLPTVHGFDIFWGFLYHLNAMEEPFNSDYPRDPRFYDTFGPRGIVSSEASRTDDQRGKGTRWGPIGKQKIQELGPLAPTPEDNVTPFGLKAKYDMTTIDQVVTDKTCDYIKKASKDKAPYFVWYNTARVHVWTHLTPYDPKKGTGWGGKTGYGLYADAMAELDSYVGQVLDAIDKSGEADNTIVLFTTDNGAEELFWPDGGGTPYHGEKATTWEGGFIAPLLVRWPGVIPQGIIINDVMGSEDWVPTLMDAAGDSKIKTKLLDGYKLGDTKFRSHLDGYDFLPYFVSLGKKEGKQIDSPRKEFFYFNDDGGLNALRVGDWKVSFATFTEGSNFLQAQQFPARVPFIVNLKMDPLESFQQESVNYPQWWTEHAWAVGPAIGAVMKFMSTFAPDQYPPAQAGGSFGPGSGKAAGGAETESARGMKSMEEDVNSMEHVGRITN